MPENHPRRRAFEMQKPRRTERAEPGRRRTERQIAADKRRREERARRPLNTAWRPASPAASA